MVFLSSWFKHVKKNTEVVLQYNIFLLVIFIIKKIFSPDEAVRIYFVVCWQIIYNLVGVNWTLQKHLKPLTTLWTISNNKVYRYNIALKYDVILLPYYENKMGVIFDLQTEGEDE